MSVGRVLCFCSILRSDMFDCFFDYFAKCFVEVVVIMFGLNEGVFVEVLRFYCVCWVGNYFIIYIYMLLRYYELIILRFPVSYSLPPVFNHSYLC